MRAYLQNEIKITEWNIRETREYLEDLKRKYVKAVKTGNRIDIAGYGQRIDVVKGKLNEHIHRLNDLKREWRYLDVADDYFIHKESIDELSEFPHCAEAILIMYC